MWLFFKVPWGWFTLIYLCTVATQGHVQQPQPNHQEFLITAMTRSLFDIENRLETKISDLLDNKISDLLGAKLADVLEAKLEKINHKFNQIHNSLIDFKGDLDFIKIDVDEVKTQGSVLNVSVKGDLDTIKSEMNVVKGQGNVLNESVKENQAQGTAILEEIRTMKQERNVFYSIINNLIVNSNHMSTKLDNININLNQGIETLKAPVDEIMLQGNALINEIKLIKVDGSSSNSILNLLSLKIKNIESEVKEISNITQGNNDISVKIDAITDQLNQGIDSLNKPYEELKLQDHLQDEISNITQGNNDMSVKIDAITDQLNQGIDHLKKAIKECPEGFFKIKGSTQCFKFFNDKGRSWDDAKSKCEEGGLFLAKPVDAVAITLRKYIMDTYGNRHTWLAARGDGSYYRWHRDGSVLSSSNSLWWPGYPGSSMLTTSWCLWLLAEQSRWERNPDHPYAVYGCSYRYYALCELV